VSHAFSDAPHQPQLCLYAADAAHLRAGAVALCRETGLAPADLFGVLSADPVRALREAVQRRPGRDLLLVEAGLRLPAGSFERLQSALRSADWADLCLPLDPAVASLDPRLPGEHWDAVALDAACWLLADAERPEIRPAAARLQLWRAGSAAAFVQGELPEPRAVLQPRLCLPPAGPVRSVGDAPLPVAALRARLAGRAGGAVMPMAGLDGRPVVLHLLHGWGGGAARFVRDLAAADPERCHLALVAESDPERRLHGIALALHADLDQAPIRRWLLAEPIASTVAANADYRALLDAVLRDWNVAALMIDSLIGHSLDALRTGLPTAVVCHDYYPAWPVLHADFGAPAFLADDDALRAALAVSGADPLFRSRDSTAWLALRQAWLEALEAADPVLVVPSQQVQHNLVRLLPALQARRWRRIPHGLAPFDAAPARAARGQRTTLRILVPGRLNGGKGEELIAALLPKLPQNVELVLLGAGRTGMRFFGHPRVHVLMDYRREELPQHLAEIDPDAALLASTVAETFSYTLSECWALRLPVIATDLGSFAERIEHGRTGLLVAPQAEAVAALLGELAVDPSPLRSLDLDTAADSVGSLDAMAAAYGEVLPLAQPSDQPLSPALAPLRRLQASEIDVLALRQACAGLRREAKAQQAELARRADWARDLDQQLRERSAWAESLRGDLGQALAALETLQAEFEARSAWALALESQLGKAQERIGELQGQLADAVELAHARGEQIAELQRYVDALIVQRDAFEAERNMIVNSLSWKLTKPLRFARRFASGLLSRLRYRLGRIAALRHRVSRSLKLRGVNGTVARIRQEFDAPPQPVSELQLPDAAAFSPFAIPCSEAPRVSIVVPVYNHIEATLTCLRSIQADAGERTPFEVIAVDDGSSDATAEQLPQVEGLRYLRNAQNLGFIGACNAGAAAARGDILVFLNNDTAVQPGWLDALVDTFACHPQAGLVGAKLVYPDGRLQEAGGIVFADGSGWNYGRFEDPADPRFNYLREVDYCSGAAIAIPRALFERFGGFDSHYSPAYYEDTDLAMKVRQAGYSVLYQPASVVVHYEGVTSGTDTGSGVKAYQVVNQQKFLARWGEVLAGHAAPGTDIAIAREHRAARRVLVIDATTPQPDQDSGSVRLVNILRLLKARGDAVTFFADNRAFVPGYTEALQQLGVEVLWHPHLSDPVRWFADNGARFDAIFVSRHYVASIYLPLARLHAPRARFVFDTVDLHYLREQRAAQLSGREDLARAAAETRDKELRLIRDADVSVVVSPVEQELLAREAPGAQVEVLSNVHEVFGCRREFADRRDLMFIGGFQHPPNIDAAEWFVREVWPLVRAELGDVRFHLIGSKAPDAVRALGEVEGVVFHGFVEDIEPYLDGCRLAVAPLRYGAGVKGKVNMSMSYGQPVVGTTVATEGMYVRPGQDVLVADDAQDFAEAVVRVYEDEALWRRLSANGLANVERHFSFEAARLAMQRVIG
jgi:O-antigen biosynthesis protein